MGVGVRLGPLGMSTSVCGGGKLPCVWEGQTFACEKPDGVCGVVRFSCVIGAAHERLVPILEPPLIVYRSEVWSFFFSFHSGDLSAIQSTSRLAVILVHLVWGRSIK